MSSDAKRKSAQPRGSCCCGPAACAPEDVHDVLERRYAKGEITKEQYEDIRRGLESGPKPRLNGGAS